MKNILKTWLAFWLVALTAICFNGCSTLPSGNVVVVGYEITPQEVYRDLKLAAKYGTREALRQDENARQYFEAALVVLNLALADGQYDPAKLQSALFKISVRELRNPVVIDALQVLCELYDIHFKEKLEKKLDGTVYGAAALTGLRDGITEGLQ